MQNLNWIAALVLALPMAAQTESTGQPAPVAGEKLWKIETSGIDG
jgi:hypothetical protein